MNVLFMRAALACILSFVLSFPAFASGDTTLPAVTQPAPRRVKKAKAPAWPNMDVTTFYMGAFPNQKLGDPVWKGKKGQIPEEGQAKCPVGSRPAVQGTADAIAGGHLGQLKLDAQRAVMVAPDDWDFTWYSVAATSVLGRRTHAAAVYCISPDPWGIGEMKADLAWLKANAQQVEVKAQDGEDGKDGDQFSSYIGFGGGQPGPAWHLIGGLLFRSGAVVFGLDGSLSKGFYDELENHAYGLSIAGRVGTGFGENIDVFLSGRFGQFSWDPLGAWEERYAGLGLAINLHPIAWMSDSKFARLLKLDAEWLPLGVEWQHGQEFDSANKSSKLYRLGLTIDFVDWIGGDDRARKDGDG